MSSSNGNITIVNDQINDEKMSESDSSCSSFKGSTNKFKNKTVSKFEPVRHFFKIQKVKNNFQGTCTLCPSSCPSIIKLGNNSDLNLRTHLAYIHGKFVV